MTAQKIIEVAAAVLQRPDGSFLLAQRPSGKIWAGYWEFPGGKIEPGETPLHALSRELHEELGVEVETAYPWITRVFTYPHATVRLNFFRVTEWSGELHSHEGQEFAWQRPLSLTLSHEEPLSLTLWMKQLAIRLGCKKPQPSRWLSRKREKGQTRKAILNPWERGQVSPMLPANAPILRALELPDLYAISNAAELGVAEFMRRLEIALGKGLRLLQLREKHLLRDDLRGLARRVTALAHVHGAKVLLNGDVALAQEVGADGVQLTATQLAGLRERPAVDWCAASCHNAEELRRAEALGCDFALLSPALPTQSHPGAAHLGWENFTAIAAGSSIPVYALGGLTHDDMQTAWQHGAHGISLLRQAW